VDIDAIAGISMARSMSETADAVELVMLKRAMEMEQMIAAQLLQSLQAVAPPASFGHKLDVLV